jgi:hypothetical protein
MGRKTVVQRVLNAEILRRAYSSLNASDKPDRTKDDIHGSFGIISDWKPKYRALIEKAITSVIDIEEHVTSLLIQTPFESSSKQFAEDIKSEIISSIDLIIDRAERPDAELSAVLAEYGLLPMFGFPTRVRELFKKAPRNSRDDTASLSSRSLDAAVSLFSPGSEIPSDHQIHKIIGFAAFELSNTYSRSIDPLGIKTVVAKCKNCESVLIGPKDNQYCLVCNVPMQLINMYEPLGFRTDYRPKDFKGDADSSGTASHPKLVIAADNPVISATGGSATDAISVQAFDSDGKQISAPTIYVLSSDQTKISDNYVTCTAGWYAPYAASYCSLTAVGAGTSKITVSSHAASSTYQGDGVTTTKVTSNEVSVRVGSVTAASFSLSLDKATYAPGEKATLTVTPLDSSGLPVAGTYLDGNATYASFFTTGGITSDYASYTGSDTTTATFLAPSTVTGVKKFTIYMPLQSSTITFKASAGAHFSAVYQNNTGAVTGTPVSVVAKVTGNTEAAAALAAVTALAVTVASLKTLITTLTNLVLKIQKKVKA